MIWLIKEDKKCEKKLSKSRTATFFSENKRGFEIHLIKNFRLHNQNIASGGVTGVTLSSSLVTPVQRLSRHVLDTLGLANPHTPSVSTTNRKLQSWCHDLSTKFVMSVAYTARNILRNTHYMKDISRQFCRTRLAADSSKMNVANWKSFEEMTSGPELKRLISYFEKVRGKPGF